MDSRFVTHYELDAKLVALETRMDSKIDNFLQEQRLRDEQFMHCVADVKQRMTHFEDSVRRDMRNLDDKFTLRCDQLERTVSTISNDVKKMRYWVVGTAISMVLATASINHSMTATLASFFAAGKEQALVVSELRGYVNELREAKSRAAASGELDVNGSASSGINADLSSAS